MAAFSTNTPAPHHYRPREPKWRIHKHGQGLVCHCGHRVIGTEAKRLHEQRAGKGLECKPLPDKE